MGTTTPEPVIDHLATQMGRPHTDIYLVALLAANYNQTKAAALLDMRRTTYQKRLCKHTTKAQRTPKVGVVPLKSCTALTLINPTPSSTGTPSGSKFLGIALALLALLCLLAGFRYSESNARHLGTSEMRVLMEGEHEIRSCISIGSDRGLHLFCEE